MFMTIQLSRSRVLQQFLQISKKLIMSSTVDYPGVQVNQASEGVAKPLATLETLHFDNLALRDLPVDPVSDNQQRQVRGACFSMVSPTPVKNPRTVAFSTSAMGMIGLPESELIRQEFAEYLSGNRLLPGSQPAAHCYCGHQFGSFAGQLGDGATMYLGEIVNGHGERWELQLKGAGKTPYSRTADGRKVLRSSIREFLCSEAMFHLGIPTTRSGSCVTSDTTVVRDIFYDGNPINERCSIISRIAPSFIRFGSFQICKGPDRETGREGPSAGRPQIVQQLSDYVVRTFYPQIWAAHNAVDKNMMYVEFFKEVVCRTASLVAQWQCVGFCHGVLNTDNMSILGLTIDYGPYGFLDRYDPNYICNASDDGGRYTYQRQPEICKWNCLKLAEALQTCVPLDALVPQLELFDAEYQKCYMRTMRKKLGLLKLEMESDSELVNSLLETMHLTGADFTNTFRCLSRIELPLSLDVNTPVVGLAEVENHLLQQCATLDELKLANAPQMDPRQLAMITSLIQADPRLKVQLGKAFQQIEMEMKRQEKLVQLEKMSAAMKTEQDTALWKVWLDKYVQRLREELAEIEDVVLANTMRKNVMNSTNPRLVLRNYIAQSAIDAAEKDDFTEVHRLLSMLEHPYDDVSGDVAAASASDGNQISSNSGESTRCRLMSLDNRPPRWAMELRVT